MRSFEIRPYQNLSGKDGVKNHAFLEGQNNEIVGQLNMVAW